jgi:hypothetical protein
MVCLLIELDGEVIEKILTGRQIRRSILFTSTQDVMAIAFPLIQVSTDIIPKN